MMLPGITPERVTYFGADKESAAGTVLPVRSRRNARPAAGRSPHSLGGGLRSGWELVAGEQGEQAAGAVVAEHELVVPVGFGGELRGPGEEGPLVLGQRSLMPSQ
jgi:hypothetical protein